MTIFVAEGQGRDRPPAFLRPAGTRPRYDFDGGLAVIEGLAASGWVTLVGVAGTSSGVVGGDATWLRCRVVGEGPWSLIVEA